MLLFDEIKFEYQQALNRTRRASGLAQESDRNIKLDYIHPVHVMDLVEIKKTGKFISKQTAYRGIEIHGRSQFRFIYDIIQANERVFVQLSFDQEYLLDYQKSLNRVEKESVIKNAPYLLCLLKIPAINSEFFWMQNKLYDRSDQFYPVDMPAAFFFPKRLYNYNFFFENVSRLAQDFNPGGKRYGG